MGIEPVFSRLIYTLQSTRLHTLFVNWNFVIPENHWLLLSQRGIQNGKDTHKHFEFCCASISLIHLLILKVSCHRTFRYRNIAQIKWITFLIYIVQKLTMKKLLGGTRTCYFPIDMFPPIHSTTDSVRHLKFGYSTQSLIITVTKRHSKR